MRRHLLILFCLAFLGLGSLPSLRAGQGVTLEKLRHQKKLTPKKFIHLFSGFEFVYHKEVQPAEVFLATEAGDCDDFAILAATILQEKGFSTRLISVAMAGQNHVVCYVEETKCYLDYNNRNCVFPTVSSDGSLADIATKVALSFHTQWLHAAEFTYKNQQKLLVQTVMAPAHPATGVLATFR